MNQVDGPQFKVARDPRRTRVGRFLTATNLDDRHKGDFHQWIYYDLLYVRSMSIWLDTKILAFTLVSLVRGRHVPLSGPRPLRSGRSSTNSSG